MDRFAILPDDCISKILSLTSPEDAARSSIMSKGFKSAADSDMVWEAFLPFDLQDIILRSGSSLDYATKKELYFNLCDSPLLLDGGKMSFKLNKATGKKCYMLCARELGISWGDNPQYWIWKSIPESRFTEVAELNAVCWLEIRGKIKAQMLSLKTIYAAYLVFTFTDRASGLDRASKALVRFPEDDEVRVELNEIDTQGKIVYLKTPGKESRERWARGGRRMLEPMPDGLHAQQRMDGWREIKLGEFFNNQEEDELSSIEIMFWETKYLNWKRGLIIEGIELRPLKGSFTM